MHANLKNQSYQYTNQIHAKKNLVSMSQSCLILRIVNMLLFKMSINVSLQFQKATAMKQIDTKTLKLLISAQLFACRLKREHRWKLPRAS